MEKERLLMGMSGSMGKNKPSTPTNNADVAQSVAQLICNQWVVGSSPIISSNAPSAQALTRILRLNYHRRTECDMWQEGAENAIPANAHNLLFSSKTVDYERSEVNLI